MAAKKGRFVWYDLMTTDVDAARKFYTEVIGWKTTKWEQEGYQMWTVGEQPIGGLMALPDEAKKMGAPPNWLAYIETDDVDATVNLAEKLGGRVYRKPADIPNVGRFAILADPQGATFATFKAQTPGADTPSKPGFFSWHELNTTDYEGAWKFYSELFGWKPTSSMDMGQDLGAYWMFGLDPQKSMGGMSNVAKQMKMPPHWMYYVTVENIDATVGGIKKAGGKILNGPMDIPGNDKIAQCMDPQGAAFAIYMEGKR